MGALSTWGRSVLVNATFRPETAPALGTLWMALTVQTPVTTDTGDTIAEPAASSYERVPYGVGTYYWNLSGPGMLLNARTVDWRPPDDDWGQVTGWAFCTESTSGMVLAYGALPRPTTITRGMRLRIPPGAVRLSLL